VYILDLIVCWGHSVIDFFSIFSFSMFFCLSLYHYPSILSLGSNWLCVSL